MMNWFACLKQLQSFEYMHYSVGHEAEDSLSRVVGYIILLYKVLQSLVILPNM